MKLKNYLILLIALFGFMGTSWGSHNTGGQIYWERNATGQYIFFFEMYGDVASGAVGLPATVNLTTPIGSITLNAISNTAFTSNCAAQGYVQGKKVYQSAPVTLNGTPPATGWDISVSLCCRSSSVTNLATPGSQAMKIHAKIFQGSAFTNANGDYPSTPKLIDPQGLMMINNTTFTLPLVKEMHPQDSVSVEFSTLYDNNSPAAYGTGYTATAPYGTTGMGTFSPYIDNDNVLRIQTSTQGMYAVGLLAKTYVNGALYSEQLVDVLSEVNPKVSASNDSPFITVDPAGSNVSINTLPANTNTGVANVHNIYIDPSDTAIITLIAFDTIGEPIQPEIWNADNNGMFTVSSWDSLTGVYTLTINPSHYPGALLANQVTEFTVFTGSYDYGCNIAGGTMHQFNVSILPASPCANICMTAIDTSNMKAYVYIDAPELGLGDVYHYWHSELYMGSGISYNSGVLPDKDTILEFPITNVNAFNIISTLTDDEFTSGSMVPCDSTAFGNLPVSAVGVSASINKVSADFSRPTALSEIRLLSRPVGSTQYSTLQVVSNPTFSTSSPFGVYEMYDTLLTPGNYEYIVEATPDYTCDTLNMNLKNWIYFTDISNYYPVEATVSLAENVQNALPVYPNPTSGLINIPLTNIENTEVMDLTGKLLMKFEKTSQIDLTELNPGIYLLIIHDDAGHVYPTRIQKK